MTTPTRLLCDHGYVMMQDGCPGCDAMEETPHQATTALVETLWMTGPEQRCTACQQPASHAAHRINP